MTFNISYGGNKVQIDDPPETMVKCDGGPHSQKLIKVRMLSNLSGGEYQKDPACTWIDKSTGRGYPLYRWTQKNDDDRQNGPMGKSR